MFGSCCACCEDEVMGERGVRECCSSHTKPKKNKNTRVTHGKKCLFKKHKINDNDTVTMSMNIDRSNDSIDVLIEV